MPTPFGKEDCKHVNEQDASCRIYKGCGSGSVYCRVIWNGDRCYSLEKPGNSELANYGHQIYAHKETLVMRDINGRCWQLTMGDYMGEIAEEDLIFVKRALLSD